MDINKGDIIIVNMDRFGGEGFKEMEVFNPTGDTDYIEYVGEHFLAKSSSGETHVIKEGDYKLKEDDIIDIADRVRVPKTNGTQKECYIVVEVDSTNRGICIFDDFGHKIWYQKHTVTKVENDPNNEQLLDMVASLSSELIKVKNIVVDLVSKQQDVNDRIMSDLLN
ncbi:hypothetical protein JOC34_000572 [Virgibacillus halotolerans]|uniref:hypothetical protein n=1 Tax=Virgibacillus halotolerans TaxID=1071053 RepID=UPI00196158BE|nr:hypothetical protein [Virgibacillus halotolerans]MBM7598215.1 hypothetical protein [Virgibacillus halotolerans]